MATDEKPKKYQLTGSSAGLRGPSAAIEGPDPVVCWAHPRTVSAFPYASAREISGNQRKRRSSIIGKGECSRMVIVTPQGELQGFPAAPVGNRPLTSFHVGSCLFDAPPGAPSANGVTMHTAAHRGHASRSTEAPKRLQ